MTNALVQTAFLNLSQFKPEWLAEIEERKSGSQWAGGRVPWQILASLGWIRIYPELNVNACYRPCFKKECEYFRFQSWVDIGSQNIRLLSDFEGDYSSIRLQIGSKGNLELVSESVKPVPTCEAWCITGPKEKGNTNVMENIVWTAYPGSITCSLQQFDWWDGTDSQEMLDRLSKYPIAVKGIA